MDELALRSATSITLEDAVWAAFNHAEAVADAQVAEKLMSIIEGQRCWGKSLAILSGRAANSDKAEIRSERT